MRGKRRLGGWAFAMTMLAIASLRVRATEIGPRQGLFDSATAGDFASARYWIGHGASVNARDWGDAPVLLLAVVSGRAEMVEYLLKNGADVNAAVRSSILIMRDMTTLDPAHRSLWFRQDLPQMQVIRTAHAKTAITDLGRKTISEILTRPQDTLSAEAPDYDDYVLPSGVPIASTSTMSLGMIATSHVRQGLTALMVAAYYGNVGLVRLLLDRGAAVDAVDGDGETALMEAVRRCRVPVVRTLLARHARVDVRDHAGFTALTLAADVQGLDAAERKDRAQISQLLRAARARE